MSNKVKEVFDNIAPNYDLMNDLLSFGMHRKWKQKMIKLCALKETFTILDCATGTADIALLLSKAVENKAQIIGIDINEKMLEIGKKKTQHLPNIKLQLADIEALPFPDNYFDTCTIAYGVRNVAHLEKALQEMARVVKPNGNVVILEFGQPTGIWGKLFKIYSTYIIPLAGKLIAGNLSAYQYLHDTISVFPCGEKFIHIMQSTDSYSECTFHKLCGGISYIYIGKVK